jgi:hypothetical protein
MRISINISNPSLGIPQDVLAASRGNAQIIPSAQNIFIQERKSNEPSSLESRVRDLTAKLASLSPGELDVETDACERELTALLAQVKSVKFANAFPIICELDQNTCELKEESQ